MDGKEKSLAGDQCQMEADYTENWRSQLPNIVDEIVQSCQQEPTISHFDTTTIPSKESVIEILKDLQDLFFPGYFRTQEVDT